MSRYVLCFDTGGTPRSGHAAPCCPEVARALADLDDQDLALCLDAAVDGAYLWRDPRDRVVWWIGEGKPNGAGEPSLRFVSAAVELDLGRAAMLTPARTEEFMALKDLAVPRTAA